jgi:hypothetical protein
VIFRRPVGIDLVDHLLSTVLADAAKPYAAAPVGGCEG